MKRIIPCICIMAVILNACGLRVDNNSTGDNPVNIDEFIQPFIGGIDLSRENQFQEVFLYGDWTTSKIMREVYVDGVLTERFDVTENALPINSIILREDHTVGNGVGIWIYAYNCILIKSGSGSCCSFEVANAGPGMLWLKTKRDLCAMAPYAKDMSGTHEFDVFELIPRDE